MDEHFAEDPNFAVICSFLDNFKHLITNSSDTVTIDDIQQFIDATEFEQTSPVVKLHLKLLRGIGFSPHGKPSCTQFSKDMIKFIEDFPERDDKLLVDLEYNYTLLPAEVKIRILKNLLEDQFQFNDSFNEKVNNDLEKRGDIRHTPAGRDRLGRTYWFVLESSGSLLLYRQLLNELTGEETWALVSRDMEGLESLIDSLQSDEVALENADPTLPSNTAPVVSSVVNMATETDSRQKMAGLGFQPMCSPLFFKAPPLRDKHEVLEDERLHGLKHCSVHLKKLNSDNEHHLKKLSCFDDYGSNRSKGKLICTDAKEIKPDTCIFDVTKSSGMKCDDTAEHKCPDLKPGLKDMKPVSENLSTKNDNNYCGKLVSDLVVKVCALSTIANDDVKVKVETNKNVNACIPSKHSVTDESVKGSVVTMLEDIKKVKDEINFATDESGKEVTTKTSIDNSSTVSEANMAKTDIHTDKNTRCSAGKTDKIDKSVNEQLKACTDKIDISDNRKLNADTEGFTCDSNHATTTHNSNSTNQQEISPAVLNSIEKCSIQAKQALRGNLQMTAMPNTLGLSSGTVSCSQFSEITIPQHVVKKTKDVQNTASRLVFLPSLSGKKFIYKLETSATSSTTVTLSSPSSLTPVISSSSSTPTVSSSSSTSTPVISSSFSSLTPVNKFQVNISSAVPGSTADMTVLNVGEKPKMCYMNKALPHCAQKCRQSPVKAVTSIQESMRDKLKEKISSPKNGMTVHAWKNDGKLLTLSSIKGNITDKLKEKIISPRKGLILYAGSDGKYYVQSTGEVFDHPSHTQSIHHKVGLSFFVHERAIAIKKKSTEESKPVQNVAHTPKCKFPTRTRKKGGMKIHYDDTESSDSSFYSDISANLSSEEEDDLDNEEAESAMSDDADDLNEDEQLDFDGADGKPAVLGRNAKRAAAMKCLNYSEFRNSDAEEEEDDENDADNDERTEEKQEQVEDTDPCKACSSSRLPHTILLCDYCDSGYHMTCLIPPLSLVPLGDWLCPPCEHEELVQTLKKNLKLAQNAINRWQSKNKRLEYSQESFRVADHNIISSERRTCRQKSVNYNESEYEKRLYESVEKNIEKTEKVTTSAKRKSKSPKTTSEDQSLSDTDSSTGSTKEQHTSSRFKKTGRNKPKSCSKSRDYCNKPVSKKDLKNYKRRRHLLTGVEDNSCSDTDSDYVPDVYSGSDSEKQDSRETFDHTPPVRYTAYGRKTKNVSYT